MLPIAVDAMGGDRAPSEILAGALQAAELGIPVLLVGPEGLEGIGELPLMHASEVIEMDDDPAQSVRKKRDSTLVRAAEAVRDGQASAMISAGNTGATMASALLRMGRISGVARPAIATPVPVPGGTPTVLLDAGANADVQADWLVQFAIMGSVYSTKRYSVENPRVGLLSIGEEPGKGDALRKEAYDLLKACPHINFIGNVEGRDLMTQDVDVVVTDGFTGNVALKTGEGTARLIADFLREAFNATILSKFAALLAMTALKRLRTRMDPRRSNGGVFLGLNGIVVKSHGSSDATGVAAAVDMAYKLARSGFRERLAARVASAVVTGQGASEGAHLPAQDAGMGQPE